MALASPPDCLDHFRSRPLTRHRDMRSTPCASLAQKVSSYSLSHSTKGPEASPEGNALWFYGLNHVVSIISASYDACEPMTETDTRWVSLYYDQMTRRSVRSFYYLLLICIREARHSQSLAKDKSHLKENFGQAVAQFFEGISGGEAGIHERFLNNPPDAALGDFVAALRWQFYNSKWQSNFGGEAWGQVTDCLEKFVSGEFTAEMMLDTVWTLCHNGGPIFNKGIFYGMYNISAINRILDVQRSGQIPELILFDDRIKDFVDVDLKALMLDAFTQFEGSFGSYVDWYKVEDLGALHSYSQDKKDQAKKAQGLKNPTAHVEKDIQEAAAKKAAEEAKKLASYTVHPGLVLAIEKKDREKAHA